MADVSVSTPSLRGSLQLDQLTTHDSRMSPWDGSSPPQRPQTARERKSVTVLPGPPPSGQSKRPQSARVWKMKLSIDTDSQENQNVLNGANGKASPYLSLAADPKVLGDPRAKQQHPSSAVTISSAAARKSIFMRPQSSQEYRPLRAQLYMDNAHEHIGGLVHEQAAHQPAMDSRPQRPQSARVDYAGRDDIRASGGRPPLSARGRMQHQDGHEPSSVRHEPPSGRPSTPKHGVSPLLRHRPGSSHATSGSRSPTSFSRASSALESQNYSRNVVIFPSNVAPPQPTISDPSPRRRPMTSTHLSAPMSAPLGEGAGSGMGKYLSLMASGVSAIAAITHETTLEGLVKHVEAVCTVFAEVHQCNVYSFEEAHRLLMLLKVGVDGEIVRTQLPIDGVVGTAASTGALISTAYLQEHQNYERKCDVGDMNDEETICFMVAPCYNHEKELMGLVSIMRIGDDSRPFAEQDEALLRIVAQQAGVGMAHCKQRQEMIRGKLQGKLLVKAAVALSKSDLARGPLACIAAVYAKKLTEADKAVVFETYNRKQMLRCWEVHDGKSGDNNTRLVERSELPVPSNMRRVLTAGVVVNQLLRGGGGVTLTGGGDAVCSVYDGDTAAFDASCDNVLATPLRTDPRAPILGMIQVVNKRGGPRKSGRKGLFTTEDEEALRDLASILASVLVRVEASREQELILDMMPKFTTMTRSEDVIDMLCSQVCTTLKADHVYPFLCNPSGDFVHQTSRGKTYSFGMDKYPFTLASTGRNASRLKLKELPDLLLSRKGLVAADVHHRYKQPPLLMNATAVIFCVLRGSDSVHGCFLATKVRDNTFTDAHLILLQSLCAQAGKVLDNCERFKAHQQHARSLQDASLEMLTVVNKREIEQVIKHISDEINLYVECSRAVLYIVDRHKNCLWTVGPADSIITADIRDNVKENASRAGCANMALASGSTHVIRDFAYGQPEYMDLLDSADMKHVQTIQNLQSQEGGLKIAAGLEPEEKTESIAALVVRDSAGRVVAVLQVMNRWKSKQVRKPRKEGFDEGDMQKLDLIVAAVSCALETTAVLSRRWETENELRRLLESMQKGQSIGLGASARVDLNDALTYVAQSACKMCSATQVAAFFVNEVDPETMDVIRFEGNLFRPTKRVKRDIKGVAGYVIVQGCFLNLHDVREHETYDHGVDSKPHIPSVSAMYCPIRNPNGKVVGCLTFQNKSKSRANNRKESTSPFENADTPMSGGDQELAWMPFNQFDEQIIQSAAQGIGVAASQFALFDQLSNISERLKEMSSDASLHNTYVNIEQACCRISRCNKCHVFMLDEKHREFKCEVGQMRVPIDQGVPGAVLNLGGYVNVRTRKQIVEYAHACTGDGGEMQGRPEEDRMQARSYLEELRELKNALGVPILNREGRIVGVLQLCDKEGPGPFTAADERIVCSIANHAHNQIQHANAYATSVLKLTKQYEMMQQIVDLVDQVASIVSEPSKDSQIYGQIVKAACAVLGAQDGHMYLAMSGTHSSIMVYDIEGNYKQRRPSNLAMRVMESCMLINNTNKAIDIQNTSRPESVASGEYSLEKFEKESVDGDEDGMKRTWAQRMMTDKLAGETEPLFKPGATRSLSIEFKDFPTGLADAENLPSLAENKMMCVPVLHSRHEHVLAAIEIEAKSFEFEWTTEDEDALQVLAGVASSLMDVASRLTKTTVRHVKEERERAFHAPPLHRSMTSSSIATNTFDGLSDPSSPAHLRRSFDGLSAPSSPAMRTPSSPGGTRMSGLLPSNLNTRLSSSPAGSPRQQRRSSSPASPYLRAHSLVEVQTRNPLALPAAKSQALSKFLSKKEQSPIEETRSGERAEESETAEPRT